VASVTDDVEDLRTAGLTNGKPAALVVIFKSPNANVIETVDRVRALIPRLRASLPASIDFSPVPRPDPADPGVAPRRRADAARVDRSRDARGVRVPAQRPGRAHLQRRGARVPPRTFGVMYLCGYSLDNLSLMALTVATGFVVDDAIVVLENVSRHVEAGRARTGAALLGAREIGFTVVSMSVSLVAVFIPLLLMGGVVGRLFREFAVTLSVAVGISLVVSLTTTAMMCGALLRSHAGEGGGRLSRAAARALDAMTRRYEWSLGWALRHPRTMLLVTLATVLLNVALFVVVPKGFFPQQDAGRLTGTIVASQDISFQAMRENARGGVRRHPRGPRRGQRHRVHRRRGRRRQRQELRRMFITLKPRDERGIDADQVIARLRPALARIAGAPTFLQPVQDLRVGGRPSSSQYQYTLQGESFEELSSWAPKLVQKLRTVPGLADVTSDQQDRGLEASLVIDRDTASRLDVSPTLIDDTLYDAFGQRQVAITYTALNQYHVVLESRRASGSGPRRSATSSFARTAARRCRSPPSRAMRPGRRRWRSTTRGNSRP
jgi:multidrug efflux pump